jgi:hypothetical protein
MTSQPTVNLIVVSLPSAHVAKGTSEDLAAHQKNPYPEEF